MSRGLSGRRGKTKSCPHKEHKVRARKTEPSCLAADLGRLWPKDGDKVSNSADIGHLERGVQQPEAS